MPRTAARLLNEAVAAGMIGASMRPSMVYAEHPPAERCSPWVAAHWTFRVDPDEGSLEHRIPLTGGAMVALVAGGPAILTGPRTEPLVTTVKGGEVYWGTHFWPWATASLFGEAERLRDAQLPLRYAGGAEVAAELEALDLGVLGEGEVIAGLDAAWSARTAGCSQPDDVVVRAAAAILASGGRDPIHRIAAAVGLSPRQLRRRFRGVVGLGPKELARLQRVRAATVGVVQKAERQWVDHALDHGFSDQAHLVRELRAFFGTRPTEIERHLRRIDHQRIVR